jgi:type IV pilus assembly protein PilB
MADDLSPRASSALPQIATEEVAERFSEKMRDIDLHKKESEAQARALSLGVPHMRLVGFPISSETLVTLSEEEAERLGAICFYRGASSIRVGALNPQLPELVERLQALQRDERVSVELSLISQHSFDSAFKLYRAVPKVREFVSGVSISEDDIKRFEKEISTFQDLSQKLASVSITDMVTLILAAAIKSRASDIHIEAEEHNVKIRFRIDGLLHDAAKLDAAIWPQIISRVKLTARLKINVADKPQDGRFTIFMTDEKIDVRVSCLPTGYGESVVMRLLMSSVAGIAFEELGLRGKAYESLQIEIAKPNGMIITTGPTGSGKTTTLYAILNKLNDSGTKIITIEDPVEYRLNGVNQSQVDATHGYTFANGLRSILRQDPDIVMVGEIRDLETAEIAMNAALTGHLVVSTLHTNDAAGTVPRLLSMQVKPFLLAPAINAMIGQRLVRRVCPTCKQPFELDSQTLTRVMHVLADIPENSGARIPADQLKQIQFFKGAGCEDCQGLGYKGRVGIYEIVPMNKDIEQLIISGRVSEYDMREMAQQHGVITMVQDGLLKALDGITTVDEVFRVAKDVEGGSILSGGHRK